MRQSLRSVLMFVILAGSTFTALAAVPSWALGDWVGRNSLYKVDLRLKIERNGNVTIYREDRPGDVQQGFWKSNGFMINGLKFSVRRSGEHILVTQDNDDRNRVEYRAVTEDTPTWSGGHDSPDQNNSWWVGTWSGYNSRYRAQVELNLERGGRAEANIRYDNGKTKRQTGRIRGSRLTLEGIDFDVSDQRGSLRVRQVKDGRNTATYSRTNDSWNDNVGGSVDSWYVGTWYGYNLRYDSDIELTISRNGSATAQVRGRDGKRQTQTGSLNGSRLKLNGVGFDVSRNGSSLRTEQIGDSRNWMEYSRNGSGGDNGDWGSSNEWPSWAVGTFTGYNRLYDADVTIRTDRGGRMTVTNYKKDGSTQTQRGSFRGDDRVRIDGVDFRIEKTSRGIRLVQLDDRDNSFEYRRT